MTMRVYNTLTRQEEPFETIEPGKVRMYVCGLDGLRHTRTSATRRAFVFDV